MNKSKKSQTPVYDVKETKRRIGLAFRELRKHGVTARQNFTCCQSCGWANLHSLNSIRRYNGAAFYHAQDNDDLSEKGYLHISFGAFGVFTGRKSHRIGQMVVIALRAQGLTVNWVGKHNKRICVVAY